MCGMDYKEQYEKNKASLSDLKDTGIVKGMRFHLLSSECLVYEMYLSIKKDCRFYSPEALKQLLEGKEIRATVKYPAKGHKSLSHWLDPDNQEESFVYHLKMLAKAFADNEFIEIFPQDIVQLKGWIKESIKALRKEVLQALDFMFLSKSIQDLCDYCLDRRVYNVSTYRLEELLLHINDFKNYICVHLDYIDDMLKKAARDQKARENRKRDKKSSRMTDSELADSPSSEKHKEEQWEMFNDKTVKKQFPNAKDRERYVLRKLNYSDGYKPRSMVRKLDRLLDK